MADDEDTKRPVRRFRARNLLVLPQGLVTGPGATNMRLDPDQVVELDAEAAQRHERFLNGRIRAGDLEEVEEHRVLEPTTAATAISVPSPRKPGRLGMTVGKPDDDDGGR